MTNTQNEGPSMGVKNCKAKDSRSWHASTSRSLRSSMCCNRANDRSQYVPLKSTYNWSTLVKHIVSFLVSQIDQHIAAASVNNIVLCLCLPAQTSYYTNILYLLVAVYKNTPAVPNYRSFDFFYLKFDHLSYLKNLCIHSQT